MLTRSSTSWTPTPYASVTTITDGEILTVTLTPTAPPPARTSITEVDGSRNFWATTSKVVPTFVCIGLAVIAAVAGFLWYCHRKNARNSLEDPPILTNPTSATASRPASMMSKLGDALGMTGMNRARSNRSFTVNRNSAHMSTSGMEMTHHADRSATNFITPITRYDRRPTDDRLDPAAIHILRDDDAASTRSFHDERDYSRRILPDGRADSRPTLIVSNDISHFNFHEVHFHRVLIVNEGDEDLFLLRGCCQSLKKNDTYNVTSRSEIRTMTSEPGISMAITASDVAILTGWILPITFSFGFLFLVHDSE